MSFLCKVRLSTIIGLIACCNALFAQPSNDECENATELPNLYEWCSEERAYKIYNATPSYPDDPTCHPDTAKVLKDIWFTFTAQDENLKMIFNSSQILGKESQLGLFTLSIYSGGCQELVLDTCDFASNNRSASFNFNIIRLQNIVPDQKYYFRIATPIDSLVLDSNLFDTIGNFEFCLDSYGLNLCDQFSISTSLDTLINFGESATLSALSDTTFNMVNYAGISAIACCVLPAMKSKSTRK
ncbi:MAG: hypothetical protein IPL46_06835 [Saprospiraceae bacterium]|nr:hypothetical protein [Saprospiraceae bacterium]